MTVLDAIREVDPHELIPHPRNPNKGDAEGVRQSLREHGWWGVVVAQKSTNRILVGHTRVAAAIGEGFERVPVQYVDVDDDMALRILLADNQWARRGVVNPTDLAELLDELGSASWASMGWSAEEAEGLLKSLGPAPTPEDLKREVGDPRPDDFWITVSVRVPPDLARQWREYVTEHHDGNEAAAFRTLLG